MSLTVPFLPPDVEHNLRRQRLPNTRMLFPWQFLILPAHGPATAPSSPTASGDIRLDQVLGGMSPTQRKDKVRELTEWIKSTPLAKRPLVKLGVQILADEGVKVLQTTVTPVPARPPAAAEYENVPPALLLPPYTPGPDTVKLAVQGGPFELGDRVVCVSSKGSPPYGLRGTIIGERRWCTLDATFASPACS